MKNLKKISKHIKKALKLDAKLKLDDTAFKFLFLIVFGFFAYQIFFFVYNLPKGIIPDEGYHLFVIDYYEDKGDISPFITNQTDFKYADLTRYPSYFYHYLMALITKIPVSDSQELPLLRVVNGFISILSFLALYKLLALLTKDKWVRLASLLMISNTLMFLVMSAGVNYDSLFLLLAILSIYTLVKILMGGSFKWLLLFFSIGFIGCISKISFFPLMVINSAVVFFYLAFNFNKSKKRYVQEVSASKKHKYIFLGFVLLISMFLFTERYVGNYLKFGTVDPRCYQIHGEATCQGDYNLTVLDDFENAGIVPVKMSLYSYLPVWRDLMLTRIFGIAGHRFLLPNMNVIEGFMVVSAIGSILMIRHMNLKKEKINLVLLLITLLYTFVIFYFVNFKVQKEYGIVGFAVQGRYLFPVLPLFYYLINYYIIKFLKFNTLKALYFLLIMLIFLQGSLYWYLKIARGEHWYRSGNPKVFFYLELKEGKLSKI